VRVKCRLRCRITILFGSIQFQVAVVIEKQVVVDIFHTIVDDADVNACSGVVFPHGCNVDVDAGQSASLSGVDQVPLVSKKRVGRQRAEANRCIKRSRSGLNLAKLKGSERSRRSSGGNGLRHRINRRW